MDWFDKIWNKAEGIFDRSADVLLSKWELDVAGDVALARQAQAFETARYQGAYSDAELTGSGLIFGMEPARLAMLAALAVGAYFLVRKL